VKIAYDSERDLLYIYFADPGTRAAKTATVMPGVYADFGVDDKLIGIEIVDASEVLGNKTEVAVDLVHKNIATKHESVSLVRDKCSK
jgi:uncharacterized protein YuzE